MSSDQEDPRRTKDWIESYMAYTENSEPPDLYKEWIAVCCIAAALQRKCYLSWGPITFYPNMYVVLVGPSGKCRKGTAMGIGAGFLKRGGIKMAAEAITREALIRELSETSASTIDVAAGTMDLHTSLTIYSQELTVFLGYDNKQLISDLTDWYDCRETWTYRTKNMGTDELVGIWVNLIGATTPDLIQTALPRDAIGGGLASRIVFVYEENKGKVLPFPFLGADMANLAEDLQADLARIRLMEGEFKITQDFLPLWGEWYIAQENEPPFAHNPNFDGYVQRRGNHILKLCIILSAATRDDKIISADTLRRAISLLERTEVKMARTFSGYGSSARAETQSRIMSYIAQHEITDDVDLMKAFYSDVENIAQMGEILTTLNSIGFCTVVSTTSGKKKITYNKDYNKGEYNATPSSPQPSSL